MSSSNLNAWAAEGMTNHRLAKFAHGPLKIDTIAKMQLPYQPNRLRSEGGELRGLPLLGVLPHLLLDPIRTMERAAHEHRGEVAALRVGPITAYLITRPDHIQHVLVDNWRNFGKSGGMWRPMKRLLGDGLVTSEGDTWVRDRRIMQPIFSLKNLALLSESIIDVVGSYVKTLEAHAASGKPLDVEQSMMSLTQHIVFRIFFGDTVDDSESDTLSRAILKAFNSLNVRIFFYFLPERLPFPGDRALRDAIWTIDEALLRRVRERRRTSLHRSDFLSLLLQAADAETGENFDDRYIRDQLVTMFVAANETTATACTWIWYILSKYPEVERKVRAEVDAVLGGRRPTFTDLTNLSYLKMVIQETMRLYPPAWFFPRISIKDDVIGGRVIPAGSLILVNSYVNHRDPEHWDTPLTFDPERFTPQRSDGRARYAYTPFGAGPRQCIGGQLATFEIQLIVSIVLQAYRFSLLPGSEVSPRSAITLRPRNGLKMTVTAA